MKRREFLKHLGKHGCELLREDTMHPLTFPTGQKA